MNSAFLDFEFLALQGVRTEHQFTRLPFSYGLLHDTGEISSSFRPIGKSASMETLKRRLSSLGIDISFIKELGESYEKGLFSAQVSKIPKKEAITSLVRELDKYRKVGGVLSTHTDIDLKVLAEEINIAPNKEELLDVLRIKSGETFIESIGIDEAKKEVYYAKPVTQDIRTIDEAKKVFLGIKETYAAKPTGVLRTVDTTDLAHSVIKMAEGRGFIPFETDYKFGTSLSDLAKALLGETEAHISIEDVKLQKRVTERLLQIGEEFISGNVSNTTAEQLISLHEQRMNSFITKELHSFQKEQIKHSKLGSEERKKALREYLHNRKTLYGKQSGVAIRSFLLESEELTESMIAKGNVVEPGEIFASDTYKEFIKNKTEKIKAKSASKACLYTKSSLLSKKILEGRFGKLTLAGIGVIGILGLIQSLKTPDIVKRLSPEYNYTVMKKDSTDYRYNYDHIVSNSGMSAEMARLYAGFGSQMGPRMIERLIAMPYRLNNVKVVPALASKWKLGVNPKAWRIGEVEQELDIALGEKIYIEKRPPFLGEVRETPLAYQETETVFAYAPELNGAHEINADAKRLQTQLPLLTKLSMQKNKMTEKYVNLLIGGAPDTVAVSYKTLLPLEYADGIHINNQFYQNGFCDFHSAPSMDITTWPTFNYVNKLLDSNYLARTLLIQGAIDYSRIYSLLNTDTAASIIRQEIAEDMIYYHDAQTNRGLLLSRTESTRQAWQRAARAQEQVVNRILYWSPDGIAYIRPTEMQAVCSDHTSYKRTLRQRLQLYNRKISNPSSLERL